MNFPLIADPFAGCQKLARAIARDRDAGWTTARRLASRGLSRLLEMASPRGRCNRQAFLAIALTFLGLQTLLAGILWLLEVEIGAAATIIINAPVLWIGTTVCIKRLHDVGRRGWWLPAAAIVWAGSAFVGILVATVLLGPVEKGEPSFLFAFAAVTLPAFGALLWLHTRASEPRANAFGPVPTGFGLSLPTRTSTPRQSRTYYASAVLA